MKIFSTLLIFLIFIIGCDEHIYNSNDKAIKKDSNIVATHFRDIRREYPRKLPEVKPKIIIPKAIKKSKVIKKKKVKYKSVRVIPEKKVSIKKAKPPDPINKKKAIPTKEESKKSRPAEKKNHPIKEALFLIFSVCFACVYWEEYCYLFGVFVITLALILTQGVNLYLWIATGIGIIAITFIVNHIFGKLIGMD
jgi:hypothetical protein